MSPRRAAITTAPAREARPGGGGDEDLAVRQRLHFRHLLPEMESGMEWLRLLQQSVDQFLRTADGHAGIS